MRRHGRRRQRGATVAEFAISSTVLFFILLGMADLAYGIYGINAVTNGAREGARYGIGLGNPQPACSSSSSGMTNAVNNSTPGLAGVTITASTGTQTFGSASDSYCQVTVSWSIPPFAASFGLHNVTVTTTSRVYENNDLN